MVLLSNTNGKVRPAGLTTFLDYAKPAMFDQMPLQEQLTEEKALMLWLEVECANPASAGACSSYQQERAGRTRSKSPWQHATHS